MFWKKKAKPDRAEPERNRIGELVDRLQQEGGLDRLEAELDRFDPKDLAEVEMETWYHFRGIAAFQRGDHALAFERFREGVKKCPGSGDLHFSLGQEYEQQGEISRMLEHFDQAVFPKVPAVYALAEARFAYLWGQTDQAWSYLAPLVPIYLELKILDTTFLHLRGLPSFKQVWDYKAAFSQLEGRFDGLTELTRRVEAECTDFDFQRLRIDQQAYQFGEFDRFKARLRSFLHESGAAGVPSGLPALQLAVLHAQEAKSELEAQQHLDSLHLAEHDFPWLDDMRLLARCELAHRFGDEARELELRQQFLERQPSLFEPDNAIYFNLLRYQERLKSDYRRTRRPND